MTCAESIALLTCHVRIFRMRCEVLGTRLSASGACGTRYQLPLPFAISSCALRHITSQFDFHMKLNCEVLRAHLCWKSHRSLSSFALRKLTFLVVEPLGSFVPKKLLPRHSIMQLASFSCAAGDAWVMHSSAAVHII